MAARKRIMRTFILIVMATSVLLLAVVAYRGFVIVDTKEEDARQNLLMIKLVLIKFREDHGRYPTEAEGLSSLVDSSPDGKYFPTESVLLDPWQHKVVYRLYGKPQKEGFLIYSLGPNGVDNGGKGDDIAVRY